MEKELFGKAFIKSLDTNFQSHARYFEFELHELPGEIGSLLYEINKCLILGFNRAAITLTNHLLERLLKLALIYNEAGSGPSPVDDWNARFSGPNLRYSSIDLSQSMNACKGKGLITKDEWKYLDKTIREVVRNGFSHANPSQILRDAPEDVVAYRGNLDEPGKLTKVELDYKVLPDLQGIYMQNFAEQNALNYFDFVFHLAKAVNQRLAFKRELNSEQPEGDQNSQDPHS